MTNYERMVVRLTVTCATSAITTKVVSSNPAHCEVYSIQHYVLKFISDLRQAGWFSPGTPVSSTNKTDHHDMHMCLGGIDFASVSTIFRYDFEIVPKFVLQR